MNREKTEADSELEERAKKYRNSTGGQFAAALEIAMDGVDRKLDPLLKRLDAIEKGGPREGRKSDMANTFATVDIEKFINGLHDYLSKEMKPIFERLAALEKGLEQIKEGGIRYCGVHQRMQRYSKGSIVTHEGSGWICLVDTKDTPGESKDWRLFVKGTR